MFRMICLVCVIVFSTTIVHAQSGDKADSLIKSVLQNDAPAGDHGLQLMQHGNFTGATQYFSSEISKDESDRNAYFNRGVANWALADTLNACRDWSAVLALGDTAMFNLLESKCHSSMIVAEDTIPEKHYKKLWAKKATAKKETVKKDNEIAEVSSDENARTVVAEMPSFPGGQEKLIDFLAGNIKKQTCNTRGTVYVNFLISPKGKILFPYVTRGMSEACNKEAMRLVKNMPAWNPGKEDGKAVYVRSNIPIRF